MLKFLQLIEKYFGLCLVLALVIWLTLPRFAILFQPYIIYIVQIILFLSCLKVDFTKFKTAFKRPWRILYISVFVMIIFPIFFYLLTKIVYPELAIGILILTAMPTAMSAPVFTDITKWNTSLTLMFTILLTLICPITVPFLIKYLIGVQIHIDLRAMILMLTKVVFIPFILAVIVRWLVPKAITKTKEYYGWLSIILLMFVIFPPLAAYRSYFFTNPIKIIPMLLYLCVISALLHILWWVISYKSSHEDKTSISIVTWYMNLTLSIVFAMQFFWPAAVMVIILFDIPWDLMLIPFKYIVERIWIKEKQTNK